MMKGILGGNNIPNKFHMIDINIQLQIVPLFCISEMRNVIAISYKRIYSSIKTREIKKIDLHGKTITGFEKTFKRILARWVDL